MNRQKSYLLCFIASLFLVSNILLYGVLNLYFLNKIEFNLSLRQVVIYFGILSVILSFLISILLFVFHKTKIFEAIISIITALGVLLWFQGNILVMNYGKFDGTAMNWERFKSIAWFDFGIWLAVIIISIVLNKLVFRYSKTICIFFLLLQTVFTLMTGWQGYFNNKEPGSNDYWFKTYITDNTGKFNFSRDKNVLLILFDEAQSDAFTEVITRDKAYRDIFKGFTYFRNSLGGYPFTYANVPLIFTGLHYKDIEPSQQFIKNVFLRNSLPKTFRENNIRAEFYPESDYEVYLDENLASNLKKIKFLNSTTGPQLTALYNLALFRYTPDLFKSLIYNGQWMVQDWTKDFNLLGFLQKISIFKDGLENNIAVKPSIDYQKILKDRTGSNQTRMGFHKDKDDEDQSFLEEMDTSIRSGQNGTVFKYLYLCGGHTPYVHYEDGGYSGNIFNRDHYVSQMKYRLRILNNIFVNLKENHVFDNSLIVLVSDHGSGRSIDNYVHTDLLDKKRGRHFTKTNDFQFVKARAIPIILAKRFQDSQTNELKISDKPVCLNEVPKTICAELKLPNEYPGYSFFEKGENTNRAYYYYTQTHVNQINYLYLEPLTEYRVRGFSWFDESWKKTGNVFYPMGDIEEKAAAERKAHQSNR